MTDIGYMYYELVKCGERKLNSIPTKHRAEVQQKLDEDVAQQANQPTAE